jgi:uncharacterized protein with HEPN domain
MKLLKLQKSNMSRRNPKISLQQMLHHAEEAVKLGAGKTRPDLDNDRLLNLALVRLMEIIGEAANRVPTDTQLVYPRIHWLQIIGLRNRLIHGYDEVDFDILWEIVKKDLPELIVELNKILQD